MLARTFLTPKQLGIDEDSYDALLKVLDQLESGNLIHVPVGFSGTGPRVPSISNGFNMQVWNTDSEKSCGTVCCIGGWMEKISGKKTSRGRENLDELFYPLEDSSKCDMASITAEQAIAAIKNFLTRGRPHWMEILTEDQL